MNALRRGRLLLLSNVALLALLTAVCLHEGYITRVWIRATASSPKPYVHSDNPHFAEALDFDTLYHSLPAVVMLGTSMTQKMEWGELLGRCDVSTRGVHGDLTSGILARVPDALALHPKAVFLEGGINDIDLGHPVAEIAEHLLQTAGRFEAAGVRPVLTAVARVTKAYPQSAPTNRRIDSLDKLLADYAAAHSLDFINLNPLIAPDGALNPQYARADGCHLTAKSYRLWADEVLRILKARGI